MPPARRPVAEMRALHQEHHRGHARDTETYQSIIRDLVLADLPAAFPAVLPEGWSPEVIVMPVNDGVVDA